MTIFSSMFGFFLLFILTAAVPSGTADNSNSNGSGSGDGRVAEFLSGTAPLPPLPSSSSSSSFSPSSFASPSSPPSSPSLLLSAAGRPAEWVAYIDFGAAAATAGLVGDDYDDSSSDDEDGGSQGVGRSTVPADPAGDVYNDSDYGDPELGGGGSAGDGDGGGGSAHNSVLVGLKVLTLVLLLIVAGVCCLIPRWLSRQTWFRVADLCFLTMFACGALIGMSFFHLIPESIEDGESAGFGYGVGKNSDFFNLAYLMFFLGFILVLLTEKLVVTLLRSPRSSAAPALPPAGCGHHHTHNHHHHNHHETVVVVVEGGGTVAAAAAAAKGGEEVGAATTTTAAPSPPAAKINVRAFVVLGALSVHSIFDGIVLGMMKTRLGLLLGAISIFGHKIPVAMSLGMEFLDCTWLVMLVSLAFFVLASPLGVIVGIVIVDKGDTAASLFGALSAGVLLYTSCEILFSDKDEEEEEEGSGSKTRSCLKALCFLVGGCFIYGMVMLDVSADSTEGGGAGGGGSD